MMIYELHAISVMVEDAKYEYDLHPGTFLLFKLSLIFSSLHPIACFTGAAAACVQLVGLPANHHLAPLCLSRRIHQQSERLINNCL